MSVLPPSPTATAASVTMERRQWQQMEQEHQDRVDKLTQSHQARASRHIPHPVEDFLFTYYTLRPAQLRRWHPGAGVYLADAPST